MVNIYLKSYKYFRIFLNYLFDFKRFALCRICTFLLARNFATTPVGAYYYYYSVCLSSVETLMSNTSHKFMPLS